MKSKVMNDFRCKLSRIVNIVVVFTLCFTIASVGVMNSAIAGSLNDLVSHTQWVAVTANSLSKQATGKVQEDVGTAQRAVGKIAGQMEGAANQAKGRANQDLGKLQGAVNDAGQTAKNQARHDWNKTQNTLDRAGNRVAETSDRAGDRVQETAENAVDAVKNFFGQ